MYFQVENISFKLFLYLHCSGAILFGISKLISFLAFCHFSLTGHTARLTQIFKHFKWVLLALKCSETVLSVSLLSRKLMKLWCPLQTYNFSLKQINELAKEVFENSSVTDCMFFFAMMESRFGHARIIQMPLFYVAVLA